MIDTLNVIVDTGNEALNYIMPQIMIFIIIPAMALLKKTTLSKNVPLEILSGILAIGAAFGAAALFAPGEMQPVEVIRFGLESLGTATVGYGALRIKEKYKP